MNNVYGLKPLILAGAKEGKEGKNIDSECKQNFSIKKRRIRLILQVVDRRYDSQLSIATTDMVGGGAGTLRLRLRLAIVTSPIGSQLAAA